MAKHKRRTLYQGRYLRVVEERAWEFVQRTNCTGIAIVIPMTDDKKVIFTEQYRVAVGKNVIEFPGGLVNDPESDGKETPESAAWRELLEETGYEAKKMRLIMTGPANTGLSTDMLMFFRASGLKKTSAGGGVGRYEKIKTHVVPLKGVVRWLDRIKKKGLLVDPKVYAGIYFLENGL